MTTKPTYEKLKQKVAELEASQVKWRRVEEELELRNRELEEHSRILNIMTSQMVDMVYYKDTNKLRMITTQIFW